MLWKLTNPKAVTTPVLRLLGPKTHTMKGFWANLRLTGRVSSQRFWARVSALGLRGSSLASSSLKTKAEYV